MPVGAEGESRADPGKHQELRAIDGARGQDHFLGGCDIFHRAVCHELDAHATSTFEVQFYGLGVEQQSEVRPRQCRVQEGASGAHAGPIRGDVHIDVAGAWAHRPIDVIQNGHTHLPRGLNEGGRQGMRIFRAADVYRPKDASKKFVANMGDAAPLTLVRFELSRMTRAFVGYWPPK